MSVHSTTCVKNVRSQPKTGMITQQSIKNFVITPDVVARHFPGARVRAGVLLVYNHYLLLVKEKSGNVGPPKGLVDWSKDDSILDAALRELREETGLNVINKSGDVCTNIYMYHRQYQKELLVYYPVFVNYKPRVHVRKREISGYLWADMTEGLSEKFECSEVSSVLFRAVDASLLYKKQVCTIPMTLVAKIISGENFVYTDSQLVDENTI